MASDTAHTARGWIVHKTPEHHSMFVLRRCDAAAPLHWRQKSSVFQAQRFRNVLQLVLVEAKAGEFLDHGSENDEVEITVAELRSRSGDRNAGKSAAPRLLLAQPYIVQREIGGQSRIMREQ